MKVTIFFTPTKDGFKFVDIGHVTVDQYKRVDISTHAATSDPVGQCLSIFPIFHTLVVVILPFLEPNHQAIQDPALTLTHRLLHMAGQN